MRPRHRKLAALNLAVLMLLALVSPASAVGAEDTLAGDSAVASAQLIGGYQKALVEELRYFNSGISLAASAYTIRVGDTGFSSDTDTAGTGWSYSAADNTLTLNGYSGGGILAYGSLNIDVYGEVYVLGADYSEGVAGDGICVYGSLWLDVKAGATLHTVGGNGLRGGDGIYAGNVFLFSSGATNAFGGTGTGSDRQGGSGIFGQRVYLYGQDILAQGGAGSSVAGCGLSGYNLYVMAHCVLTGGTGAQMSAPGIYYTMPYELAQQGYRGSCQLGANQIRVVYGGNQMANAIQHDDNSDAFRYSVHTTLTGAYYNMLFTLKRYVLTLCYDGGVNFEGNATGVELKAYYPAEHQLADYIFRRDGFTQVGWKTATNAELIPLNTVYQPTTNADLWPYWAETEAGDIVLNALEGTFGDGSHYQTHAGSAVLPESLTYPENDTLLGWCSVAAPKAAPGSRLLSGVWYEGGSAVQADPNGVTAYYAQTDPGYGQYAVYHPAGGTLTGGGDILVQTSTKADLTAYTPTAAEVTAPAGYELAGWAAGESADAAVYAPGAALTLTKGATVHLYARWKGVSYTKTMENGMVVTLTPAENRVEVTLPDGWCAEGGVSRGAAALYDGNGRMVECSTGVCQEGADLVLSMTCAGFDGLRLRVFALGAQYEPVVEPLECLPAQLPEQR